MFVFGSLYDEIYGYGGGYRCFLQYCGLLYCLTFLIEGYD